ncbi:hypothetical protein AGMMS49545_19520 [Betaproteobacteria bacterium]|nr:hypothetical protein AGMMS49545_19520 [Betaproteobacteria bacterium]
MAGLLILATVFAEDFLATIFDMAAPGQRERQRVYDLKVLQMKQSLEQFVQWIGQKSMSLALGAGT